MIEKSNDSLRERVLQCAKSFKTGWVEFGQVLFTVWKDKHYKSWGYSTFDTYVSKEINIRKLTALKLLRSYYFLEKEEPGYLKGEYAESADPATVPGYEAVDVLRLAKTKKALESVDYNNLKKNVFQRGKDVREVRKDLTALIKEREDLSPDEAWAKKNEANLKRLLTTLKSLKKEIESAKSLPQAIVRDIGGIIEKIEAEI